MARKVWAHHSGSPAEGKKPTSVNIHVLRVLSACSGSDPATVEICKL